MSSFDSGKPKVRLIAEADEGTEIFVIDGGFRRVASALRRMETDLPSRLYTVKFKRGGALAEVDPDLLPGSGPVRVQAPTCELEFASAAPMEQTINSHEYHQDAAAGISRRDPVPIGLGQGGLLFLFVRDIGVGGTGNPAEGMTLHDPRGRKVIDFGSLGETGHERDTSAAAWYGCNIELKPGFYRLRVPRRGMPGLEQSLILVEDWQIQVFVVRDQTMSAVSPDISGQPHGPKTAVDLAAGTIFMARPGRGFDPWDPSLRLTELSRQGLASGRIPVSEEDLMQMFAGKFENPMLGLFAAHLLLPLLSIEASTDLRRSSDPEILRGNRAIQQILGVTVDGIVGPQTRQRLRQLLEEVASNVERMLGNHPDVHAIRNELAGNGNTSSGAESGSPPPMLRRSWETLVRSDPEYRLARVGSILERIADRTWGAGPWLVWQVPPAASRKKSLDPGMFRRLVSRIGASAAEAGKLEQLLGKARLNPVEESLARLSLKRAGISAHRKAATSAPPSETETIPLEKANRDTARLLGIPVMTLERNLASAIAKIDAAVE